MQDQTPEAIRDHLSPRRPPTTLHIPHHTGPQDLALVLTSAKAILTPFPFSEEKCLCLRYGWNMCVCIELDNMQCGYHAQFLSLCFRISGSGAFVIIGLWKITPCQLDISGEVCLQIWMLPTKEKMGNLSSLKVLVLFYCMISMRKRGFWRACLLLQK